MFDAKNVNAILPANIQFTNAFANPLVWNFYFKNGVLPVDLHVVENMIGSISNCCPFCYLLFRVDHMVGSVAKQKLCMYIPLCTRHYTLRAKLLQKRRRFQRILKAAANGHDADIEISDAKGAKKLRVCTVSNLRVGDEVKYIIDPFFVYIDCHDLMLQLR